MIAPENAEFHYHLGESYYAAGKVSESVVELEKSLFLSEKQGAFEGKKQAMEILKKLSNKA